VVMEDRRCASVIGRLYADAAEKNARFHSGRGGSSWRIRIGGPAEIFAPPCGRSARTREPIMALLTPQRHTGVLPPLRKGTHSRALPGEPASQEFQADNAPHSKSSARSGLTFLHVVHVRETGNRDNDGKVTRLVTFRGWPVS
jgi:hypothetical protein